MWFQEESIGTDELQVLRCLSNSFLFLWNNPLSQMFIISASIKMHVHLKTSCINSSDSAHLFSRPTKCSNHKMFNLAISETFHKTSTFNHFPCSTCKSSMENFEFYHQIPNPQVRVVGFDKPNLEAWTRRWGLLHPENKHLLVVWWFLKGFLKFQRVAENDSIKASSQKMSWEAERWWFDHWTVALLQKQWKTDKKMRWPLAPVVILSVMVHRVGTLSLKTTWRLFDQVAFAKEQATQLCTRHMLMLTRVTFLSRKTCIFMSLCFKTIPQNIDHGQKNYQLFK